MTVKDKVYSFPTKHKEGFTWCEVSKIVQEYPSLDIKKFESALQGATLCIVEGEELVYHYDIEKALNYSLINNKTLNYD